MSFWSGLLQYDEELNLLTELLTHFGRDPFYLREALEEWNRVGHSPDFKLNYRIARKIHIGAIFALQELFTEVLRNSHALPLLLACCLDAKEIPKIRERVRDVELDFHYKYNGMIPLSIAHIFLDLFDMLSTSLIRYKELFLGIKEVDKPEKIPEKMVSVRVTDIPEEVKASLGILDCPLLCKELITMLNNTVFIVTHQPEGIGLEWIEVEKTDTARVLHLNPSFFTVEGIPHVFLVAIPEFLPNLIKGSWITGGFSSHTIVELLFFFKPEEWARFTREVIISAARA